MKNKFSFKFVNFSNHHVLFTQQVVILHYSHVNKDGIQSFSIRTTNDVNVTINPESLQ